MSQKPSGRRQNHNNTHTKQRQERQRTYKRSTETRSRNHCCRGKVINITFSVYVSVALLSNGPCACAEFYCHL